MTARRALVIGVRGQDGSYLARLLLEKGYEVWGTSRDAQIARFDNLERLEVRDRVRLRSMAPTDLRNTLEVLEEAQPDEVYSLGGQTSVGLSFAQPRETFESICSATLNLLEGIRRLGPQTRYYNACSSECFGDTLGVPANEDTPFRPCSPYGVAKAASHWLTVNYRRAYGLHASSGILCNHESPLRPERFVTRKIVKGACRIRREGGGTLSLGNLSVARDWGWAPEYVGVMWRILQQEEPGDFVVGTGETHTLREFVSAAFDACGLDWQAHVREDPALQRPTDLGVSRADPGRAREILGWEARYGMHDVVRLMVESEEAGSAG